MSNVFRFSVNKDEKLVDMDVVDEVVYLSKNAEKVGKQFESELAALNVNEHGGLKNFIREQLEATERDGKTRRVLVDGNGLADFVIEKLDAQKFVQVNCDYRDGEIDWNTCKDLAAVYINRDNPNFDALKDAAVAHGIKKVEATISDAKQCSQLAEMMRLESKVTGNPAAVFFPHAYTKAQAVKLVQIHGVIPAKACAKIGGAVAVGKNFVDVITGEKSVEDAAKAIAESTAEKVLLEYASNAVLSTAVGQAVRNTALKIGGQVVTGTIGSTGIGAAALTGVSAADAIVAAVSKDAVLASTGVAAAAITEVGGVTAAVASSVGLTGTAGAITAGTAGLAGGIGAVAALATPLAPVAAAGAVAYGVGKLLKKIF